MEAIRLSRGAQRCLELLQWYSSKFKEVYPKQATLAKTLKRSLRQTAYYLKELKSAGLLGVQQEGPGPATYTIFKAVENSVENQSVADQNCIAIAELLHSLPAVSITEFKSVSLKASAARAVIASVENYFDGLEIDGRPADSRLIERVAELLGDEEGLKAYRPHVREWRSRSGAPYSWGIFIRLAEDIAGKRGKPVKREHGTISQGRVNQWKPKGETLVVC